MLQAELEQLGVKDHNVAMTQYVQWSLSEGALALMHKLATAAGLEEQFNRFVNQELMTSESVTETLDRMPRLMDEKYPGLAGLTRSSSVVNEVEEETIGERETRDTGWLVREMEHQVGIKLGGKVTLEELRQVIEVARDLLAERYGWQAGLKREAGAVLKLDSQGNPYLVLPDGGRVQMWDCFDGSMALMRALPAELDPKILIGETDHFSQDVFVRVRLPGGQQVNLSVVPTQEGVEIVAPEVESQWRNIRTVDWDVALKIEAMRLSGVVGFSHLRPLAVKEGQVVLGGAQKDGEDHLKITLAHGGEVLEWRLPVRAMQMKGDRSSELSKALENAQQGDVRQALERALKEVGAEGITRPRSPDTPLGRVLGDIAALPLDDSKPYLPPQMPARTGALPGMVSDAVNTVPAEILRWRRGLSDILSADRVVLPPSLLDRMGEEDLLRVLRALPREQAGRVLLLGDWKRFEAFQTLGLKVVSEEDFSNPDVVPANAVVRVIALTSEDELLAQRLRERLSFAQVMVLRSGADLMPFLRVLSRALGSKEISDDEFQRLARAFLHRPDETLGGQV